MKAWAKGFGPVSIAAALLLFPPVSDAQSLGALRVSLLQGDVQVKIAEVEEWVPASVNMSLVEGDELWVPEGSRAAVQTYNGAHVRLDGNTALQVLRMDRDSFQFHLVQGDVYVLNRAPKRGLLQFDTPDASIRSFGNATFRIECFEGGTDVSVYRGSVLAESGGGTTTVRAGSMLALGAEGYAVRSPLPPPDDWRSWNAQRDRIVLARGNSYRYLPEDLRVYSSDFDEGGRWVHVPEYGYCWTPTAVVVSDWAPYRHGRWVWRGGDYVWVGYEPWGWAPYHYGRWAFVVNVGWLWVPPARGDVFWAPGYVGWVRTGDYVAWVPLAPRETYYGRGHYGRYSRNITNVNVTQVHVTNVYRNVNVTNSVTVVHQNTFVTGRPSSVDRNAAVTAREDFTRRRNVVVGPPPIQPARTSHIPVVRAIPEAKRPPAAVRQYDVKELRQSRPLVKERDRSAMRPQAQPRSMEVKKIEKPVPPAERARERRHPAPAERGRPPQAAPPEKARPQPVPAERGRTQEAPADRGKAQEAPADRGRPPQTAPQEKTRPQAAPDDRGGRPQGAPAEKGKVQGAAPERDRPQQAAQDRARPNGSPPGKANQKETPPENGSRENRPGGAEREGGKERR
jgi:hypothetical protein